MAQGKVTSPTSTPFSTSGGTPITPNPNDIKPSDFTDTANATGQGDKTPPRNPAIVNRPQPTTGDAPGDGVEAFRAERQQQPTSFQQRTAADRAADGSPFPKAQAPSNRAGTGSLGNPHRPFKLKGG